MRPRDLARSPRVRGMANANLIVVNVLLWIVLVLAFIYVSLMLFAAWIEHRDRQQGAQILGSGRRLSKARGQRDL